MAWTTNNNMYMWLIYADSSLPRGDDIVRLTDDSKWYGCSHFDDFNWPWTRFLTMISFESPLSLSYMDSGALEVLYIYHLS